MHKILPMSTMLLIIAACPAVFAAEKEISQAAPQNDQATKPPQMSDIPTMQEQGKRITALMEKIQSVTDPAERKRMLAEATCPQ
jgi:hypothetical protein